MNYSIHDIVRFRVDGNQGWLKRLLGDSELRGFEADGDGAPDFIVHLGRFNPETTNSFILDNKFFLREDYLYTEDSYRYARWKLEMTGFERGEMKVRIQPNLLGRMLVTELITYPLMWLQLNKKGYPMIHASGVTIDGNAFIFAGRGAAGKSTIALDLVAKGCRLLGDHFVVLGEGEALSFPSPLHVMDFNLAPVVSDNMKASHRRAFQARQLFHRITGRRLATKIQLADILPDSLAERGKLHSIFLILPGEKFQMKEISRKDLIHHLMFNQKLEQSHFTKYMLEYACLFPESRLAGYWARYEENLRRVIGSSVRTFVLEVPHRLDAATMDSISRQVFG